MSIVVDFVYPAIPLRNWDWHAYRKGWEPGEPEGWGETKAEAVAELEAQEADRAQ